MSKDNPSKETPMMEQFRKIKEQYPDALLLFRCGDFYETYAKDAILASTILNITLTKRNNGGSAAPIEMAGFPFHALDTYLPKLVRAGYRVAICDQLEDPKTTKTLVKRGMTELVTPSLSYSDSTLSQQENNYVACVHFSSGKDDKHILGLAFLDLSTGEFLAAEGSEEYVNKLLQSFAPKEVLFLDKMKNEFTRLFGTKYFTFCLDDWMLNESTTRDRLLRQFQVTSTKGFGLDKLPNALTAAGAILIYLDQTQHLQTAHIQVPHRIETERYVWLDPFTIRNLELFSSVSNETNSPTLYNTLNQTLTPMGMRMLHRWIALPLKELRPIQNRQQVVKYLYEHEETLSTLRNYLQSIQDLERLVSKIATGRISPRGLVQLGHVLELIPHILTLLSEATDVPYLQSLLADLSPMPEMMSRIKKTIVLDPPAVQGRPNTIASEVDSELDHLRNILDDSKGYLQRLQQDEAQRTGIQSLKISYNNVFGYYLEVRNTYKDMVPADWIRKQTLVNAERYITPQLKEYEQQILSADDKILIIENRIFNALLLDLQPLISPLQHNAAILAQLDCLASFALTARQHKYVCPEMNDSLALSIHQGRHPVIEQHLPHDQEYVPNDVYLSNEDQQIIILTGPNMAGKSALLRQTALIVLMAQMGSFVPAESASIGLVDKVFTRVGAGDNIASGESTFMVEMNEAASILNNLSERSLVLFDELGRGTSTYDGISIAWAIVEYIHEHRFHAKTFFATHYHELNEMAKTFSRIRNFNVSVREVNQKIIFLRRLVPGGAEHSFGIHVASLAGLPKTIVKRANEVLKHMEKDNRRDALSASAVREGLQLSLFQLDDPVLQQIRDEVKSLDINSLTPLEALNKLGEIKKLSTGHSD